MSKTVMLSKTITPDIYSKYIDNRHVVVSRKLDGVAARILGGKVISRQGNELTAVRHLADKIPEGVVGELYCPGMAFEDIAGDVKSKDGRDTSHIQLYAYDHAGINAPVKDKFDIMEKLMGLKVVPWTIQQFIGNFSAFEIQCSRLCDYIEEKQSDTNICEGLMIRPDEVVEYVPGKRSYNMLRYVHRGNAVVQIIGVIEALTNDHMRTGMLGGVAVIHHETGVVTHVGVSNMPHDVRRRLLEKWRTPERYANEYATIEFKRSTTYEGYREGQIVDMLGWSASK